MAAKIHFLIIPIAFLFNFSLPMLSLAHPDGMSWHSIDFIIQPNAFPYGKEPVETHPVGMPAR